MKKASSDLLQPDLAAELDALAAMPDALVDTRDAPEVRDWSGAERGRFYRPAKRQITLRLDADVVDFFEKEGPGYQTRLNAALREYVAAYRWQELRALARKPFRGRG
ncbi:BrnA antitoxin family protein [Roseomonas sp. CCTCC AB2023176]|uniref:BrnA antitoxin family protein n=1 Tax=Roseomonas sp. CCTCC AB2023176 TaxID=3342640 RepID=UPI0035DA8117